VVLPPDRAPDEALPVCYRINGFSGSHRTAWIHGPHLVRRMGGGGYPRMLYVFLNAACPQGHHVFANSVNNGPWGDALITELIPALESRFGAVGRPEARFLTGHSSGGWSSAWLQVTYPDFFNGSWSSAPDPVDFRRFLGVDIYSARNMYLDADGKENYVLRSGAEWIMTLRDAVAQEDRGRYHGAQFGSFDYTFSPRRDDGRPMRLYDHETGAIDPVVAQAWKRYDISAILRENWWELAPKLRGKLRFYCGMLDDLGLEASVLLLQDELGTLGSDAEFILVEGRDHRSLFDAHPVHWPYADGMLERIHREMLERWEESQRHAPKELSRR
jgi:hypothetical protein